MSERRRLWDRRSPFPRRASDDRRGGERRSEAQLFPSERRARSDRRNNPRRDEADRRAEQIRRHGRRRKEVAEPFTSEEITDLKERFAAPGPVSCPACGSRFTFGASRRRGADTVRRVVCLGCGRAAVINNSRAARILVVANVGALRDALQAMLASAGHEVVETDDAAVALHAYQSVPADVVIIDVLAPGRMDAPEFLRRMRRSYPDARIVAMAGRPSFREVDPLAVVQGLGAVRTVRIPLSRDDLLRIVEESRP